ncbi:MAG: helix-turn-helix domain-containing protein [Candidatus Dadabacteria bacterium]|nr:helix-turn-helix domain-containing protein [Candidatus Dadabacteria bacterium]
MNKTKHLKSVDESGYLSVSEASQSLGVKEPAIRNYLYDGKLTTYKFKGLTLLAKDEIENWRDRQRK